MKWPIPRKWGSAYAPATLPLCARAQAAVRPRLRPRDKRMNLRSKVPKPTQPSVHSSRLAIRFGLAFYDREQSVSARFEDRLRRPSARGCSVRRKVPMKQASINPVNFAAALRNAMSEAKTIELLFAIWEENVRARPQPQSETTIPRLDLELHLT